MAQVGDRRGAGRQALTAVGSGTDDVIDNTAANRFELSRDGHTAELVYRLNGKRLVLVHTEVPEALGGHGIGGELVRAAVSRAARDGLTLVPVCPYARQWLEKHPGATGDVAIDWQVA